MTEQEEVAKMAREAANRYAPVDYKNAHAGRRIVSMRHYRILKRLQAGYVHVQSKDEKDQQWVKRGEENGRYVISHYDLLRRAQKGLLRLHEGRRHYMDENGREMELEEIYSIQELMEMEER